MRRPAVYLSAVFGVGIAAAYWLQLSVCFWGIFMTAMLAFFVWMKIHRSNKKLLFLILCVLSFALGAVFFVMEEMENDPFLEKCGSSIWVKGVVQQIDQEDESVSMVVNTGDSKVLVRYYGQELDMENCAGKEIRVHGTVQLPQEKRNPRCFDYRLYLRSCGIRTTLTADAVKLIEGKTIPFLHAAAAVREMYRTHLSEKMDEQETGILMAILFGDKVRMEEELYENFQRNGTAHVLAVSGLHVGVVYGFFAFLWRRKNGTGFYLLTIALLLMYMALADFTPSVVRAAMMVCLHAAASVLHRRYDMLSAAAVTFGTMLLINPYQLFHTGFQLSFLAIASLAVILPFIRKFYHGIFLSSAAIQLGMTPYTAFVFNYVSLGGIFANIPVIFMVGILLPIALCSLICLPIPGVFAFVCHILSAGCRAMIAINNFFYMDGRTSLDVVSPPVWSLILYYGILFFMLSETGQLWGKRRNWKRIAAFVTVLLLTAAVCGIVTRTGFEKAGVTFVDVGQGDCIHVRTEDGKNYLIDGGGSKTYDVGEKILKPYLLKNGVRKLDGAFVTHLHEDHYGGIRSLEENGMVSLIGTYEANAMLPEHNAYNNSIKWMYLYAGKTIDLGEGAFLEVLAPERKTEAEYQELIEEQEDENKSSLIFKLHYEDFTILLTGDIDASGEQELVESVGKGIQSDVLKIAHHGSKYSSSDSFLAAVKPKLAVFQVGKNNYGHPSSQVIQRLEQEKIPYVRTDRDGAAGLVVGTDGSLKVIRMIH